VSEADQYVRRAGRASLSDGRLLLWSVAEGRRGRRWRARLTGTTGGLESDLLLELAPDGAPARLEVTTAAGMLTLHPETDQGSAHGNVVVDAGVRPIALPWSPGAAMQVAGHPITAAAIAHRLAASLAVGAAAEVPILTIDDELAVRSGIGRVRREDRDQWTIDVGGQAMSLATRKDGVPRFGPDADEWPLEE
jgi:hypothetical protein